MGSASKSCGSDNDDDEEDDDDENIEDEEKKAVNSKSNQWSGAPVGYTGVGPPHPMYQGHPMAYHPHPYYCGGNPPPHLQPGAPGYNPTYIHPAAPPIHYAQVPQIGNPYHQAPPKASYPEAPPPNYYQHVADGYSAYYGDV